MRDEQKEARLATASRLNQLVFPEYESVGWVKFCALDHLPIRGLGGIEDLTAYRSGELDSVELRLWLIHAFLSHKICDLIPESSGAMGISETLLSRASQFEAEELAHAISAVAQDSELDYPAIMHSFFFECFHPGEVQWFTNASPTRVSPGTLAATVGIDRQLIGMYWLG